MSLAPHPDGGLPEAGPPRDPSKAFSTIGRIITAVVALLSLLPSAVLLADVIEIPESLKRLVTIVIVPISVVVLITVVANGHNIRKLSSRIALAVIGGLALIGATSAVSYYLFADAHVFRYQGQLMIAPVHPSPEAKGIIEPWSNKYDQALDSSPRSDRLQELLAHEKIPSLLIMFVLIVTCQLSLIVAMVGSALKLALESGERRGTK